jgi:hypothetical protein
MKTEADGFVAPGSGESSAGAPSEQHGVTFSSRRAAFGMLLEIDPAIPSVGFAASGRAPAGEAVTSVRLDPRGVAERWSARGAPARRTRELAGIDGVTLLTVDFSEGAGYLLWALGVGRVLIAPDGLEVLCDPEPNAAGWWAILPAQALPLAATLRGFEIVHAAGVVLCDEAVLLAGEPAAGKSSIAAALLLRGGVLLGDDAVALEGRGRAMTAHPSFGVLHLRPAEYERLSADQRSALGPSTTFAGRHCCSPGLLASPTPFGHLFLLERSALEPAIELLAPVDPFALLATTFNLSVRTPERLVRHLDLAAALAATGRIYRLRIGPVVDATRLAELIDAHLSVGSP